MHRRISLAILVQLMLTTIPKTNVAASHYKMLHNKYSQGRLKSSHVNSTCMTCLHKCLRSKDCHRVNFNAGKQLCHLVEDDYLNQDSTAAEERMKLDEQWTTVVVKPKSVAKTTAKPTTTIVKLATTSTSLATSTTFLPHGVCVPFDYDAYSDIFKLIYASDSSHWPVSQAEHRPSILAIDKNLATYSSTQVHTSPWFTLTFRKKILLFSIYVLASSRDFGLEGFQISVDKTSNQFEAVGVLGPCVQQRIVLVKRCRILKIHRSDDRNMGNREPVALQIKEIDTYVVKQNR